METDFSTKNPKKSQKILSCTFCDYNTYSKKDLEKHEQTDKHKKATFSTEIPKVKNYICNCGKCYKDRSGLWKHRKICCGEIKSIQSKSTEEFSYACNISNDLIMEILKQNQEFQKQILELTREKSSIIHP